MALMDTKAGSDRSIQRERLANIMFDHILSCFRQVNLLAKKGFLDE
jgi:hypothetical protein